ncbi:hypothetical protein SEA_VORVOLAKOS_62 [Streptomyces phage Vorvolakos]|uniref:Uncharacterized protein n=3 Tax=Flowerpowervirus flowerpower TaxID=2846396 RepID=A0A2U8UNC4_9CAUD|nr:hypothetical protein HWB61_gp40 [Streptomyces phage FlowerPower]QEA11263.1 hypothetical protein SEA_GEOSTIN_56 [Streptomyces phage Geostin]QFP94760.1 hypothetical protein SEA_FABIAN_59 [Streptomyces phage Fabian]QZD97107.1 hypothetical protein SEA_RETRIEVERFEVER_61 [Streptomyces phage RetrieverFever]UOW93274.1 hypothetical protein SEA_VORVOLAKOS_62 [Streptomyces phage Vorvolakos]AWN05142.1 hypothetical protein SEA_FLOWERPOWER_61 [Streptomyces phage FlowerPower]
MEITYRIPSKKVPYGYLEFTCGPDDQLPDPQVLANGYAEYIRAYQAAEVAAFERPPVVVVAPVQKQAEKAVEDAVKILDEGLDGVTEVNENDPPAPWDKTSDETEATNEKPWDLDDSDWDI